MASQLKATTGMRPPRESTGLNARLRYLPGIMAQKKSNEQRAADLKFRNRQFQQSAQQSKDSLALQNKAQRMSAGVAAANLGMGVQNLQQAQGASGALNKSAGMIPGGVGKGITSMFGSGAGGFTLGQGISSGLAGFGASQFAGDNKFKKGIYGAAAGGLMGLMSGSGGLAGGLGGAVFGGLGSLFG